MSLDGAQEIVGPADITLLMDQAIGLLVFPVDGRRRGIESDYRVTLFDKVVDQAPADKTVGSGYENRA
tara:strand:- start:2066 stop:2269 length:204 start_codon:yes stop_codon:yes gene_type:complete